jgi:hypothetical protein
MNLRKPVVLAGSILVLAQIASAQSVTYTGEAAVAKVNVLGVVSASIEDTGPLPANGGSLSTELLSANLPDVLSLNLLSASTNGENNQVNSSASVAQVNLSAAGVNVAASVLTSNATAACSPSVTGSSTIAGLTVNGLKVKVTGAPNQTIPLLVGSLVINEQISSVSNSPTSTSADMLVNALHLRVAGIADVVISSSHAAVSCTLSSGPPPE